MLLLLYVSAKKMERMRKRLKLKKREEKIGRALEEVLKGKPCQPTAKKYGLPEPTLRYRLARAREGRFGKNNATTTRLFTDAQENMLKEHCLYLASIGNGLSDRQILDMAKQMARISAVKNPPTKMWLYKGFLSRHPEVKMVRRLKKKDKARAQETGDALFRELFIKNVKDTPGKSMVIFMLM